MMNPFFLEFTPSKSSFELAHGDTIVLQGSCFSEEMAFKLSEAGHAITSNSFGTLFHPTMLAINLLKCFEELTEERIFQRNDLFFSWDASSIVFGNTQEELELKLKDIRKELKHQLLQAKCLIVTFGSAWGYELIETNEMVANCHKVAQSNFQKFLSTPYEMVQDWLMVIDTLKAVNPSLQIVFTVSPVRHIKDGLVENNLSKARLIEAVQQLVMEEQCHYFPSYELQVDCLRDYRFYKEDRIHPTSEAVQFIWEKFEASFFSEASIKLNAQVIHLRKALAHKSIHVDSEQSKRQKINIEEALQRLLEEHKEVIW